jgi:hypothetical protein
MDVSSVLNPEVDAERSSDMRRVGAAGRQCVQAQAGQPTLLGRVPD